MLTHRITVHKEKKPKIKAGGPHHKLHLLLGALKRNKLQAGDNVYEIYSGQQGVVIDIYDDLKDVQWTNSTPLFVEVYFYEMHESFIYNPQDLKLID